MIHCQKCSHINAPEEKKCSQCGANLLPGISFQARLGVAVASLIIGPLLGLLIRWLVISGETPTGWGDLIKEIGALIVSYGLIIGGVLIGIYWLIRIIPKMERYQQRGKRHMKLDPRQAIADFSQVVELYSKKHKVTANLNIRETWIMRGKMYKEIGQFSEAKDDFNNALNEVTHALFLAKSKNDTEGQRIWKEEQEKVLVLLASLPDAKKASLTEPPVSRAKTKQREKA